MVPPGRSPYHAERSAAALHVARAVLAICAVLAGRPNAQLELPGHEPFDVPAGSDIASVSATWSVFADDSGQELMVLRQGGETDLSVWRTSITRYLLRDHVRCRAPLLRP